VISGCAVIRPQNRADRPALRDPARTTGSACSAIHKKTAVKLAGMSGDVVKAKAVLFDLDGTLFDRDASFLRLVEDRYDCFAADIEGILREVFVRRVVEMDGHGHVDKAVVYRDLARELCLSETMGEYLTVHFRDA
jgi:hypothetical protein